jgi:hypothetical protein
MSATLVASERVDLVDDDRLGAAQQLSTARRGQQQVERFGRRDQDVRRMLEHRRSGMRRRVARAQRHAHLRHRNTELLGDFPNLGERALQILLNVGRERLERRHVHDLRMDLRGGLDARAIEPVETNQERGEGLAGSGGSGDQRVLPTRDRRPALGLRGGGSVWKPPLEPGANRVMAQHRPDYTGTSDAEHGTQRARLRDLPKPRAQTRHETTPSCSGAAQTGARHRGVRVQM